MATTTPNLSLTKPDTTDAALIGDLNDNADILDNAVTLGGTQTLTNKTLTSPTINTPTIASPTITGTVTLPAGSIDATDIANRTRTFALAVSTFGTSVPGTLAQNDLTYGVPVYKLGDAGTGFFDAIGALPDDYVAGTQLVLRVRWWMETATSGNVVFTFEVDSLRVGAAPFAADLGSVVNDIVAVPGVADEVAETSFTTTTAPTAGDWLRARFARVGGDASDTAAGDLNAVAVIEVEYTADS